MTRITTSTVTTTSTGPTRLFVITRTRTVTMNLGRAFASERKTITSPIRDDDAKRTTVATVLLNEKDMVDGDTTTRSTSSLMIERRTRASTTVTTAGRRMVTATTSVTEFSFTPVIVRREVTVTRETKTVVVSPETSPSDTREVTDGPLISDAPESRSEAGKTDNSCAPSDLRSEAEEETGVKVEGHTENDVEPGDSDVVNAEGREENGGNPTKKRRIQ